MSRKKSDCSTCVSSGILSISLWSLVSSAYNFTGEETPVDISLTYIIIKMGPKIVPWGTSDFTEVHNEWMPRKTTCCDRTIIKKLWNQLKRGRSIPHISYLWSRGLCGRLSNALGKSKRVMSVGRLLKMKKWSSQWTQFMQLRKEAWKKKFRTSTGFEPVTLRYRCDALPTELWSHWRWDQVNCGFVCSRERNEC